MDNKTKSLEEVIADRERYRMLVEHVSDWIWEVDQNGIYTYASPQIKDILGYEPDEIIGRTPFDLMVPEEGERIGPIFVHHVENKLPIKSLENRNLHKDGQEVILETSGSPILDEEGNCIGYRGIDRDITLRKQEERKQQRLLDIIEANPEFISTFHIEGQDYYYNPAAVSFLG
ncbi:PAS domain S-box protein [Aciduricibacillus chroicocephali]|uniref:histidine kinase n=1 Tax=Aciduricibacillus chroicocephali TaxID=3054939 RepID=A0ABY9KWS9_9BACI|nr:PAS domain S-box protein [Bacillaceae bacterium 44XB]